MNVQAAHVQHMHSLHACYMQAAAVSGSCRPHMQTRYQQRKHQHQQRQYQHQQLLSPVSLTSLDNVARCPCYLCHNGPVGPCPGIEQAGLAYIGPTHNRNLQHRPGTSARSISTLSGAKPPHTAVRRRRQICMSFSSRPASHTAVSCRRPTPCHTAGDQPVNVI
jgi:hypothetical protein